MRLLTLGYGPDGVQGGCVQGGTPTRGYRRAYREVCTPCTYTTGYVGRLVHPAHTPPGYTGGIPTGYTGGIPTRVYGRHTTQGIREAYHPGCTTGCTTGCAYGVPQGCTQGCTTGYIRKDPTYKEASQPPLEEKEPLRKEPLSLLRERRRSLCAESLFSSLGT